MKTVTSKDGTRIAYDQTGQGEPLIIVDGALCYRASGPSGDLAKLLQSNYTVITYDRRGRGDSGDTQPYAVESEVEDIEALINAVGGSAFVYGVSSGAALALEAANRLKSIKKLGVYEAPFIVDDTFPARPPDLVARTEGLIADGKRGAAVKLFMKTVGVPSIFVMIMPLMPAWSKMTVVAHTIPYDYRTLGDTGAGKPLPADHWQAVTAPTLVMDGGKSPAYMRHGMQSLAKVLPNAQYRTLDGQTHIVNAAAHAPVLKEFFV